MSDNAGCPSIGRLLYIVANNIFLLLLLLLLL